MKFVISVPGYNERCGGSSVLLELAKRLSQKGHDTKVFMIDGNKTNNPIYSNFFHDNVVDDETIVIYSEMDVGNRLGAKKVVRLVLYGAHMYDSYEVNEIIYYHAPFCKNNNTKQFLTVLRWPPGFENKGMERKNNMCYAIKKGMRIPEIRKYIHKHGVVQGINVEGKSHKELIEIFNTTKYFYCYDPCCFLVIMALMCGCIVIQHPIPGYTAEEWMRTINITGLNGIAYGVDGLRRAEETIQYAQQDCENLRIVSDSSIDKFISDMQTESYDTSPCYKFNDSPYSLQHVMK